MNDLFGEDEPSVEPDREPVAEPAIDPFGESEEKPKKQRRIIQKLDNELYVVYFNWKCFW